jgi:hypothetical protein
MLTIRFAFCLLFLVLGASLVGSAADEDLKKKPITTWTGPPGDLLRGWWKEGSAAGHVGDWYDNRDAGHSPLQLPLFPQLRQVDYSEKDRKAGLHYALQPRVLPHVVFGNSSTSASPETSGSNIRTLYCVPRGLTVLAEQYRKNNLYIYPEHRDHDPGHNGVGGGFGDLYPTNTPYLIASQGSSGSDLPFMQAVALTLAAFRPDVKKKLVETGLLMPTIQMLLRSTNGPVARAEDYYRGKAHPTVFDGSTINYERMVQRAHAIRVNTIPPLVQLEVVEEDKPVHRQDYFEPPYLTEQLATTPAVIARIWRGHQRTRKIVVSAEKSIDLNKYPLTFRWEVLRGDDKHIRIKPRNKAGSVVEITLDYHERRPIEPGSKMASNRVDIGVFVHNGLYPSAPGFITFYSLDNESRTYDERGRIVEMGYGMGFTEMNVPQFIKLLEELSRDGLPARFLAISPEQRQQLASAARETQRIGKKIEQQKQQHLDLSKEMTPLHSAISELEKKLAQLRKEKKEKQEIEKVEKELLDARTKLKPLADKMAVLAKSLSAVEKEMKESLEKRNAVLGDPPLAVVTGAIIRAMRSPGLWNQHSEALLERYNQPDQAQRRARIDSARKKLVELGIIVNGPNQSMLFQPARSGKGDALTRLSAFERAMLDEFNGHLLNELILPGLIQARFHRNVVDKRLTTDKHWRDVYQYDGDRLVGWKRYHTGVKPVVVEFTAEGWLVLAKDAKGRPTKASTVIYGQAPLKKPTFANTNPLVPMRGDEVITFEYEGDKRKIKSREKVKET